MDLYGDLPPAKDASALEASLYSSAKTAGPSAELVVVSPAPVNDNEAKKAGTKPFGGFLVPNFKPRKAQSTVKSTAKSLAPAITLSSSSSTTVSKTPLSERMVGDQASTHFMESSANSSIENDIPPHNSAFVDSGFQEFNTIGSFDVSDAYEPRRPNDYISWCEERLEMQRIAKLEAENKKLLEEAERTRKKLEEERAAAAKAGDLQKLQNSMATPAMGRGRGRGLSNLPSWITQQNKPVQSDLRSIAPSDPIKAAIEKFAKASSAVIAYETSPTTNDKEVEEIVDVQALKKRKLPQVLFSKPSCVLLLKNMVAPQDVDDLLAEETKQECLKYGPVARCIVYEVVRPGEYIPEHEAVRTFVQFERQESAGKCSIQHLIL